MDLKETAERERIRFVENELDLSVTFLQVARTEIEMGEKGASESLVGKARTGFETAGRFLSGIENEDERERLQGKHEQLGQQLLAWEQG